MLKRTQKVRAYLIFFINEKVDSQAYVVEKIESILAAKSRKFTNLNFSNMKLIQILLEQLKQYSVSVQL